MAQGTRAMVPSVAASRRRSTRELRPHVLGCAGGAAQQERPFERHEHVVGEGVDVSEVEVAGRRGGREELGDLLAPDLDGVVDQVGGAVGDQLLLGEHGDVEAVALRGHDLLGRVLEVADERDDPLRGIGDRGGGVEGRTQLADVGGDVPLRQGPREVELGVEVVEERALGGPGGLEHLVDGGGGEAVLDHQVLGGVEDPLAIDGPVLRHNPLLPDQTVCYKQTNQSVSEEEHA